MEVEALFLPARDCRAPCAPLAQAPWWSLRALDHLPGAFRDVAHIAWHMPADPELSYQLGDEVTVLADPGADLLGRPQSETALEKCCVLGEALGCSGAPHVGDLLGKALQSASSRSLERQLLGSTPVNVSEGGLEPPRDCSH